MKELVQVFCKLPQVGRVKTRLIPALGEEGAARLAAEMLSRLINEVDGAFEYELHIAGEDAEAGLVDLAGQNPLTQRGSDLGERMKNSLDSGLERASRVVLIGADCPLLNRDYVRQAFRLLDDHAVVFGPVEDGGYCLIGIRDEVLDMFDGVNWGSGCARRIVRAVKPRAGELRIFTVDLGCRSP